MRLSRSQRRTGTRRPQRGSVGRVRLYNVTDDAVVDGPSQVVLGGRKVAIRRPRVRRAGAELRIQRGALRSTTRRSESMPGSVYGRSCSTAWITRNSLWAVARIHPGIRLSVDPTTDRGQSYMALSKPRTTEPGSRDDHADTGRHLALGATHLPGAAPVTAEIA